jgi:hypothetical protein
MAKQKQTTSCEYVINYPFQLLEKLANDDICTAVGGPNITKKGKLPFAFRGGGAISEFAAKDVTICTQLPEDMLGPTRRFSDLGYTLRCPVGKDEPPDNTRVFGLYVTVSCGYLVTSAPFDCKGTNAFVAGVLIPDGTIRNGTASMSCTQPDMDPCTSQIGSQCLPFVPRDPTGTFEINWVTATGITNTLPRVPFWSISITDGTTCAHNDGVVCNSGPGNVGAQAGNDDTFCGPGFAGAEARLVVTAIRGSQAFETTSNWRDSVDEDGNYFGIPVLNL